MLAPGTGKTRRGDFWTYVCDERPWGSKVPPACWYQYSPDWKGEHPRRHLRAFRGSLHADGYAGFNQLYEPEAPNDAAPVREVACWMHVRRRFFDLYAALKSPLALEALELIRELYAIVDAVRTHGAPARIGHRQAHSSLVLARLHAWLTAHTRSFAESSAFAKALRYPLKHWEALTRFIQAGTLEIDNGAAERK